MTFETLPVVHVDGGRFPEYPEEDPDRVLTALARRFGRVVLVDVRGVRRNDADLEFLAAAARRRSLWADAGSRFATDAMDLFVAGAEAVTMRWNTLDSVEELEEAAEMCQPGTLFVGIELPHGRFLEHPRDRRSAAEVAQLAESLGVGVVVIGDAESEDALAALPPLTVPRYVQGAASAGTAQAFGFQGALLAAAQLPEEAA